MGRMGPYGTGSSVVWGGNENFLRKVFGNNLDKVWVVRAGGRKDNPDWRFEYESGDVRGLVESGGVEHAFFSVGMAKGPGLARKSVNFERLACVVVDDLGVEADLEGDGVLPPPSWVLETSDGSYQWGWILEDTPMARDRKASVALLRAAAKASGGDEGGQNAVRLVRLPRGHNFKEEALGRDAWKVRVACWEPGRVYRGEELMEDLGLGEFIYKGPGGPGTGTWSVPSVPNSPGVGVNSGDNSNLFGGVESERLKIIMEALDAAGVQRVGETVSPDGTPGVQFPCPWRDEHSDAGTRAETSDPAVVWMDADPVFSCFHAHCSERGLWDLVEWLDEELGAGWGLKGKLAGAEFRAGTPRGDEDVGRALTIVEGSGAGMSAGGADGLERMFRDRYVFMKDENVFYELKPGRDVVKTKTAAFNALHNGLRDQISEETGLKGQIHDKVIGAGWVRSMDEKRWAPGREQVFWDEKTRVLNTWKPGPDLAGVVVDAGDEWVWDLWLEVFGEVFASDDPFCRFKTRVLDWLGWVFWDVETQPGWHVMVMGEQGIGKDILVDGPGRVGLGENYTQPSTTAFMAQVGDAWQKSRLVLLSELSAATLHKGTSPTAVYGQIKHVADSGKGRIMARPLYGAYYGVERVQAMWVSVNPADGLAMKVDPGDRKLAVWHSDAVGAVKGVGSDHQDRVRRLSEAFMDVVCGDRLKLVVARKLWERGRAVAADAGRRSEVVQGPPPGSEGKDDLIDAGIVGEGGLVREWLEELGRPDVVLSDRLLGSLREGNPNWDQSRAARVMQESMPMEGYKKVRDKKLKIGGKTHNVWVAKRAIGVGPGKLDLGDMGTVKARFDIEEAKRLKAQMEGGADGL